MPESVNRRAFMTVVGAGAAGAAALNGAEVAGLAPRTVISPAHAQAKLGRLAEIYKEFGDYIFVAPTKLGGGAYALDLGTGKTRSWISYNNYGDRSPISHHLAAFPSPDPYKGFEFINNTQGGKNLFLYGIPTKIKNPDPGFKIYRVKYDGTKMNLVEDVAQTTGIGLGVHVTVAPEATSFAVGDGQKDVCAIFDRASSKVLAAYFFDWEPSVKNLKEAWTRDGTLTIKRIHPDSRTGKYDLQGAKGIKIDWELVPGGELYIEEGKVTGKRPLNVCALDGVVFDPRGRWAATSLRTLGLAVVHDRQKDYQPVAALHSPKGGDQVEVVAAGTETGRVKMDRVLSPAHQVEFSPTGESVVFMNGVRQNTVAVFDSTPPDPTKRRKRTFVEHPDWGGLYPQPFHMVFAPDANKFSMTLHWPSPTRRGAVAVIDTGSGKILKQIDVGPDIHTVAATYDGKYVVGAFSGFQTTESGLFILDARTDELVGYLPSPGGHHDCVIVPRTNADLRYTRRTTT